MVFSRGQFVFFFMPDGYERFTAKEKDCEEWIRLTWAFLGAKLNSKKYLRAIVYQ